MGVDGVGVKGVSFRLTDLLESPIQIAFSVADILTQQIADDSMASRIPVTLEIRHVRHQLTGIGDGAGVGDCKGVGATEVGDEPNAGADTTGPGWSCVVNNAIPAVVCLNL